MIVVGAIIRNLRGYYLLQLRDEHAPSFKNCWTLFGGIVEHGESPKQALLRELQEELSLLPTHIRSLKQIQENIQDNGTQQIIFELTTDATLNDFQLGEGKEMQFVSEQDLFSRMFAFNIKQVLSSYTGIVA